MKALPQKVSLALHSLGPNDHTNTAIGPAPESSAKGGADAPACRRARS
jgi:hypothetical protein